MAEDINATCSICGKGYHVCLSCKDAMTAAPWKIHTCTSEHFKIYQIIHGLSTGVYDEREAKAKLKNVDLSDLEDLRDNIKETIKKVMGDPKKAKAVRNAKPVEPMVVINPEPVEVPAEDESEAII